MFYEIKNICGIDCIFAPMQEGNSVTIEIGVKAGSVYETKNEAGISHVLEHMFFKGGKKRKTPKDVAIAMDKIGANFNAGTGENSTSYYVKAAPQFAEYGLEVLADMLIDAQFSEPELEREKGVIIQELKMYEDNPKSVVAEKRQNYFFGDNSYGRPIIGFEENIHQFKREDLIKYKNSLYTKDNLSICIAGKILNQGKIEKLIEKLFNNLPQKATKSKPDFKRDLPKKHINFFKKDTEQNHLIISMQGLDGYNKKRYAANLLSTILGGNMSSRLFQNIREKLGICYYIGAGHSSNKEYGLFLIRAGLEKERFKFGMKKINEEIDNFLKNGFSDEEFLNAKNYIKGNIQMGIESSDEMAGFLLSQYLFYKEILSLDEILKKYEQVKKEDIIQLLPMLDKKNRYTYYIE